MKKFVVLFLLLAWWSAGYGNNVRIEGSIRVTDADVDAATGIAKVKFRLSWDNSWRDAFNYDAVYLFLKYKVDRTSEKWHHAYLADEGHVAPEGYEFWLSKSNASAENRNEGIFIYRSGKGYGSVADLDLELHWKIDANPDRVLNRPMFTAASVFTSAMGIEMVYVPRGAFRAGDTESTKAFFTKDVVFPAKYDLIGTDSVISITSETPLSSNPPEFATNRMNDVSTDNSNAWVGASTRLNDEFYDYLRIQFDKPRIIRSMAIESVAGGTPATWDLQGYNGTADRWETVYPPKADSAATTGALWGTGSRQAYPCTRTLRVANEFPQAYSIYRLRIIDMGTNTTPVIKNISMSEHDIFSDMDNSVLITGTETPMNDCNGLYANDEEAVSGGWNGKLHAEYPNGYGAFFVMKYEISQEQYVSFLNKLESAQQRTRTTGSNLESLLPDQYVFGPYKTKPCARNGIKLASIGAQDAPYVFVNDLDNDGNYSQSADGQTIACNFLNAGDMLAYADWCGLRPLTELEFEKMSRRPYPDPARRGEFAWNKGTNDGSTFTPTTSLLPQHIGTRAETTDGGNVNAEGRAGGPFRSGIYATTGTSQTAAGATFWGVMDVSGNLSGIYYNVNSEGRMFRGTKPAQHGNGVIDERGGTDMSNEVWPQIARGFCLKGGNYRDLRALARISDRTRNTDAFATINEVTGLKDSTMTFRLGRTAEVLAMKSEVTLENGITSATTGAADSVCSGADYAIKGKVPAEVTGAYEIAWFMSSDEGKNWDVLEGESAPVLNLRNLRNINAPEDVFRKYWFRWKIFSNLMDVEQTNPVCIFIINHDLSIDRLKDTVDVYDYSHGIRIQVPQASEFKWTWFRSPILPVAITPEYIIKAGKIQKHYFKHTDFTDVIGVEDMNQDYLAKILLEVTVMKTCAWQDTIEVVVKKTPNRVPAVTVDGGDVVNNSFACGDILVDNEETGGNDTPGISPFRTYRTILIGEKCWFAQNLNRTIYTKGDRAAHLCYSGLEANCNKYGRLYNFYAATLTTYTQRTTSTERVQGICPKGWHLPTNAEWIALYAALGKTVNASNSVADGQELKSPLNDWTYKNVEANIGANRERFSGLPAGGYFYTYSGNQTTTAGINSRSGYYDLGERAWWWTSTTTETTHVYWHASNNSYIMQYMPSYVRMDSDGKTYFNIQTAYSTYPILTNTIFHSTTSINILDNTNSNNGNALDRIKQNFYMSVRCVRDAL